MRTFFSATALAGLLWAGAALATPPAGPPAPATAASTPTTPQLTPADQKRVTAIQQYQHDLVTVLALRADSDYLLGAAILAQPFKATTPGLDFEALSGRAASGTASGPATRWVRLGVCQDQDGCPNADAFGYLKQHAADNAAVWLVALDLAAVHKDASAEHAALRKAAAAKVYDDYYGKVLAAVAKAVDALPPLAATTSGAHDGQPDTPAGVRVLVALNAAKTLPRPDLAPLVALCDPEAVGGDKSLRSACLELAHTLQWGSSPMARGAGLHIQGQLEPDQHDQTSRASRDLAWQVQQYSTLMQRSLTDAQAASRWLAAARNGGTELSLILATLRANGVPLGAPDNSADTGGPARER